MQVLSILYTRPYSAPIGISICPTGGVDGISYQCQGKYLGALVPVSSTCWFMTHEQALPIVFHELPKTLIKCST